MVKIMPGLLDQSKIETWSLLRAKVSGEMYPRQKRVSTLKHALSAISRTKMEAVLMAETSAESSYLTQPAAMG
jgi:hypothetical protein